MPGIEPPTLWVPVMYSNLATWLQTAPGEADGTRFRAKKLKESDNFANDVTK